MQVSLRTAQHRGIASPIRYITKGNNYNYDLYHFLSIFSTTYGVNAIITMLLLTSISLVVVLHRPALHRPRNSTKG